MQRYQYEAFGLPTATDPDFANSYAFTGREWDKELGLYFYRARYYDPMEGRFVSKDPIGFAGGDWNLYGYVQGNPVNAVDPTGEIGIWGAAIGAGVEIGLQAFNNYRDGCDLFDFDNYDWWDVGVSAAVGALGPGWVGVGKTTWRSGGAIKTLTGQLDRARTVNRVAKIGGRIQRHRSAISDVLITQGAFQGAKAFGKSLNDDDDCRCQQR